MLRRPTEVLNSAIIQFLLGANALICAAQLTIAAGLLLVLALLGDATWADAGDVWGVFVDTVVFWVAWDYVRAYRAAMDRAASYARQLQREER